MSEWAVKRCDIAYACLTDAFQSFDLLTELLRSHGHKVELTEIQDRNFVELWVKGELIYKCIVTELDFGELEGVQSFHTRDMVYIQLLQLQKAT